MRRPSAFTILLVASVSLAGASHAQGSATSAVLRGFVLSDADERPIAGAEIVLEGTELRVRAGEDGAFRLAGIPAGIRFVGVRALGYRPIRTSLRFASADSLERDFLLAMAAVPIAPVEVRGKEVIHDVKLAEFARRRERGIGSFITQARLDSLPGRRLSQFVQEMAGVSLLRGKGSTAVWAVGTRPNGSLLVRPGLSRMDMMRGAPPGACYAKVILDGVPVYSGQPEQPLWDIDQLDPSAIAGLEYYASGSQTPAELGGTTTGTCGVLVIWTR